MGIFDLFKARKNTEKKETSLLAAQKYGEHVRNDLPRKTSLLAAQKYGEHVKHNNNEEEKEYGTVTCIPTVLSSLEPVNLKPNQRNEYSRELSLLEFGEVDWAQFGARLKQEQLLPPSYDRNPTKVTIGLSKRNKPKVEIVFNSKTSDSYRTVVICNDEGVFEYTNGALNQPTRPELIKTWKRFKEHIIYKIEHNNKQDAQEIKKQAKELQEEAKQMLNIDMLFEEEKKFLERHKDDTFEFFGYLFNSERETPFFVAPEKEQAENVRTAEMVTPFSPKTLEFCVLRLNEEEKFINAEDEESLKSFVQRCNKIASQSIYKTDKWEKTINLLVEILKKHAEEYRKKHPELCENEKE